MVLSTSEIGVQSKAVSPSENEVSIADARTIFILMVDIIATKNRILFIIFYFLLFRLPNYEKLLKYNFVIHNLIILFNLHKIDSFRKSR